MHLHISVQINILMSGRYFYQWILRYSNFSRDLMFFIIIRIYIAVSEDKPNKINSRKKLKSTLDLSKYNKRTIIIIIIN